MWPLIPTDPIFGISYPRLPLFPAPVATPSASQSSPPPPLPHDTPSLLMPPMPPNSSIGALGPLEMSILFARCFSGPPPPPLPSSSSSTFPTPLPLMIPPCPPKLEFPLDWRASLPCPLLPPVPPPPHPQPTHSTPFELGQGCTKALVSCVRGGRGVDLRRISAGDAAASTTSTNVATRCYGQISPSCSSLENHSGVKRCKKISATLPHNSNEHIEDIRRFARAFKMKRLSLGLTQTQIGRALSTGATEGPTYSQSAICRFEKLDITPKSAQRIKPVLERWLADLEGKQPRNLPNCGDAQEGGCGGRVEACDEDEDNTTLSSSCYGENLEDRCLGSIETGLGVAFRKRKGRTNFSTDALDRLNHEFSLNTHPSGARISQLANQLNYDREVVRVWFCNKRQSFRNTTTNNNSNNNNNNNNGSTHARSNQQQQTACGFLTPASESLIRRHRRTPIDIDGVETAENKERLSPSNATWLSCPAAAREGDDDDEEEEEEEQEEEEEEMLPIDLSQKPAASLD